jgi:hypothetical protein
MRRRKGVDRAFHLRIEGENEARKGDKLIHWYLLLPTSVLPLGYPCQKGML